VQNAQMPQHSDYIKAVYFVQPPQTSRKLKKVMQKRLTSEKGRDIIKTPKQKRRAKK
jgi:hypothetical protein